MTSSRFCPGVGMLHSDPFGIASSTPEQCSQKAQAETKRKVKAVLQKIKQNGKQKKPKPKYNKTYGYKY